MKRSLSDYSPEYAQKYGYSSLEELYAACDISYYKMMRKPNPTNTKDIWALNGKQFKGAKAFVRAAMPVLQEEHPERYEAMISSPYVARSVHRTPPSNWNKQIYWNSLGGRLITHFWDIYEDGHLAYKSQNGKVILPSNHKGKLLLQPPVEGPVLPESDRAREGKEKEALVKVRVNQSSFRKKLLKRFKGQCCITGLNVESLLVASHIKPWAESEPRDKLAVENGLLLNTLHDHAFERHLITIDKKDKDYIVMVSNLVAESKNPAVQALLREYCGKKIYIPPSHNLDDFERNLEWHREKFHEKERERRLNC